MGGSVSLKVARDFWETTDILKTNTSWTKLEFAVEQDLAGIRAKTSALAENVESMLSSLENSFAATLGSQVGTPIAFFIGSAIKAHHDTPLSQCEEPGLHTQCHEKT